MAQPAQQPWRAKPHLVITREDAPTQEPWEPIQTGWKMSHLRAAFEYIDLQPERLIAACRGMIETGEAHEQELVCMVDWFVVRQAELISETHPEHMSLLTQLAELTNAGKAQSPEAKALEAQCDSLFESFKMGWFGHLGEHGIAEMYLNDRERYDEYVESGDKDLFGPVYDGEVLKRWQQDSRYFSRKDAPFQPERVREIYARMPGSNKQYPDDYLPANAALVPWHVSSIAWWPILRPGDQLWFEAGLEPKSGAFVLFESKILCEWIEKIQGVLPKICIGLVEEIDGKLMLRHQVDELAEASNYNIIASHVKWTETSECGISSTRSSTQGALAVCEWSHVAGANESQLNYYTGESRRLNEKADEIQNKAGEPYGKVAS